MSEHGSTSDAGWDAKTGDGPLAWFCLRSQPKREHIAASHLRQELGVEVFLPRIRFRRSTRRGLAWVTEALFPKYLFARFDLQTSLRAVRHARGVAGCVHFGAGHPTVPDAEIDELRSAFGQEELFCIPDLPLPGAQVHIAEGPLKGLSGLVTHVYPARERVRVLLTFLGGQNKVEMDLKSIVMEVEPRLQAAGKGRGPPALPKP